MSQSHASVLEQATAALARRDHSAAGLVSYLEQRGADAGEAAEAVERLRLAGYVDDRRLAAARSERLAGRNYGDAAIRSDLERRGVSRDLVDDALTALEPERERADALAERAGRTPRTARRLLAKGFSTETVAEVMRTDL